MTTTVDWTLLLSSCRRMPAEVNEDVTVTTEGDNYPDGEGGPDEGEVEDLLMLDLTHEEIKAAFR